MKRTLFLMMILVTLAAISLFGCGGDDDDDNDNSPADDDTAAADDSADDDADDDSADDVADDTVDDTTDDTGDDDTVLCDPDPLPGMTYDESPSAGFLRLKAEEYDDWHLQWHQPNYGSTVETVFTDAGRTAVAGYGGIGDSCIWTGTYLASQALRYHVTKDPEAKANAIKSVNALSRHMHVTGRNGFIARYVGPADDPHYGDVPTWCPNDDNCHMVTDGEFAGDFWIGNTSRDQYTGWFFGLALAYDLVDDADMRETIRDDMSAVLDRLMSDYWYIVDTDGQPTTAGPHVLPAMQQNWALIGWHITGAERYKAVFDKWAKPENHFIMQIENISLTNRYVQHYGLNLAHENFFNLMRLSKPYCDAHEFIVELFTGQTHHWVDLSHNAFFTLIHMSQSGIEEEKGVYWDSQYDQMLQDITDFRPAPNFEYYLEPPPATLDPISVFLTDLEAQFPWLEDIIGGASYQALDAYPVLQQCSTDFLWQRNAWNIYPCGSDNPAHVNPGADYLIAYWMASAYGYITKDM